MNYLNIPVRFYQSFAPVPESQRLFFILKQKLSNNTKATLHTCINFYYHHYLLKMKIMKITSKIIIIIMYQAEKSVALLIILTKISWSNYIGKHGSDNIEGLSYERTGLFNISAMVRPKNTWGSYQVHIVGKRTAQSCIMKINLKSYPEVIYWYSSPQSLPQAVEIPTFTFIIYICYAVTVEETEEPVVGQNTLRDTSCKVRERTRLHRKGY